MNEIEKDQIVGLSEQESDDILGPISLDKNNQMIEDLAEAILNRIFEDDRLDALKHLRKPENDSRKRKYHGNSENFTDRRYITLEDWIPDNNKKLQSAVKANAWPKEYLQIITTLYEELLVENKNFPMKPNIVRGGKEFFDRIISGNNDLTVLLRIEVFMLALLFLPTPAFVYYGTTGVKVQKETPDELKKRMSLLGLEFLFLLDQKEFIKNLDCEFLTRNIKLLVDFFIELERDSSLYKTSFTLRQDVGLGALCELNDFMIELKNFAEEGIYRRSPHPRLHHRVRDDDLESSFQIIRPSRIEMTKQWGKSSKKLLEAVSHFADYKSHSILLYRSQIKLVSQSERVSAVQFKHFFSYFNKKARKPNGFQGYLDYLYFWKEDFETKDIVLDLVWVIDAAKLMQKTENELVYKLRNIPKELKDFLQKALDEKLEFFELQNIYLEFTPIPILQNRSDGLTPELLIERGDKSKWEIFQKRVLPYFVFLEILDPSYSDEMEYRFRRGQSS